MKFEVIYTGQFKKDVKLLKKQGKNFDKLFNVIEKLANGEALDPKNRDHSLSGNFSNYRECHVEPDWLLIYQKNESTLVLLLVQTGSHSDLFN